MTPVPVANFFFSTNGGTSGGGYSLEAGADLDDVNGTLDVQAAANSVASVQVQLLAETQFQVEVVQKSGANPPQSIKDVPIILLATGGASCNGSSGAAASVTLGLLAPLIPLMANCNEPLLPDKPYFETEFKGQLPIGEPDPITKTATAGLYVAACSPGPTTSCLIGAASTTTAHAAVDPTIEIDPSFAYAEDFELEYSPGFSPGAVPEPSTWLLLASGFGVLILRRGLVRRRNVRP